MNQVNNHQGTANYEFLSLIPFADKMSAEGKRLLAQSIQFAEFPAGTILKTEGEKPNQMPILVSGSIKVFKASPNGKRLTLYHLEKGNTPCLLAAYSILKNKNFPAEVIVDQSCEVIIIPADTFRTLYRKEISVQRYVIDLGMHRINHIFTTIEQVAFHGVDERLASFLLEKFTENKISKSHKRKLDMSHQEIAREIGTAREVVSRLLKNFEKENFIRMARRSIELVNY
ncbi:MAG: Crp/Fnr family transcriptional regulator, partial [Spirochaetaceae bacterium]